MFPTLLALTAALSSPGQVRQAERQPLFPSPYEELDVLCLEANEVESRLGKELERVAKLCQDLLEREEEASFNKRVSLLLDFVRMADEAARYADLRKGRFDKAYEKNPLKTALNLFERTQRDILGYRHRGRVLIYGEFCTYRWPGERGKKGQTANSRFMTSLAKALGMEGEIEKFLRSLAGVEIWATDQYRLVADSIGVLLSIKPQIP